MIYIYTYNIPARTAPPPPAAACQTPAYVSIRQHTSAFVSIRQHTSAYVSMLALCEHLHHPQLRVEHLRVHAVARKEAVLLSA